MKSQSTLKIKKASLGFQGKALWKNLNLDVKQGEFIAVIGANGSGKTALLKAILGQLKLSSGEIELLGSNISHGSTSIGYIPQHRKSDAVVSLRAKDFVRLGLDGHRFGIPFPSRASRQQVAKLLAEVGASELADSPIAQLSGGQFQRLRVAQAVISNPKLILADEPLSALDLKQQQLVADLINRQREQSGAAVLFVTHDVNPILQYIDRVLYLANGKFRIGTPDEVLRSDVLTKLYGRAVDVVRNQGRVVVLGSNEHDHHPDESWV
ncbi:MAG: metal ABC transporter ATP-binding protein [Actinomycetota bacterium]